MNRRNRILRTLPKYIVAGILLQTLWFKFGIGGEDALNESKQLFSSLTIAIFGNSNLEPLFRIGTGVVELLASILIILPKRSLIGALLASGVMLGALISHVFFIGISVDGDGGILMFLATIVLLSSVKIIWDEQEAFSKILP
ncbi:DoxX family protein [Reichenbachiella versicolor]|uniref:DoxX family protein n=1 Tax=Reichenbachiella versicolor TaxID=1821036 RepID=UPI000D6DCF6B|nr:DoxX family protein [Reichenbachiella versicolor]